MLPRLFAVLAGVLMITANVHAQIEGPKPFGKTADGTTVETYTLKNKNGVTVKIMTLGATITEINVPDKAGKFANVVLGFDDVKGYESKDNQYFGCTVGRVANRIAKGKFTLEGKEYTLAINNEPNHLHGGAKKSLDKVVWKAEVGKSPSGIDELTFSYSSPDGEEGYPGKVDFRVIFTLRDRDTGSGMANPTLQIYYRATTDRATPINLTNHSYFNLAGAGADTVLNHDLRLDAKEYVPVNETLIPTGKVEKVADTIFDFTKPTRIGERIEKLYGTGAKGYDHCYVLSKRFDQEPTFAASLHEPKSGRTMMLRTTQPGTQLYTGNFLFGQKGKDGKEYKLRSAVCLEPGHLPDAVNQPTFPSIILRPNDEYRHICQYTFSAE